MSQHLALVKFLRDFSRQLIVVDTELLKFTKQTNFFRDLPPQAIFRELERGKGWQVPKLGGDRSRELAVAARSGQGRNKDRNFAIDALENEGAVRVELKINSKKSNKIHVGFLLTSSLSL